MLLVSQKSTPGARSISVVIGRFPLSDFFPSSIIVLNFVSSNEISAVFSFHFVADLIDSIEALRIGTNDAKDDDVKEFMWRCWFLKTLPETALLSAAISRPTLDLMRLSSWPISSALGDVEFIRSCCGGRACFFREISRDGERKRVEKGRGNRTREIYCYVLYFV